MVKEQKKNLLGEEKQSGETSLSSENQSSITKCALRKEQSKSEILWALKSVMSHFSYSSSKDIADIYRAVFPDSRIAHNMSCGPTKLPYLFCFGIPPFFKQQLLRDLKKAPCFVISFDESFNQEVQKEQVDLTVRYFSKNKCK